MKRKILSVLIVLTLAGMVILSPALCNSRTLANGVPEPSPPTPGQVGSGSPYKHLGAAIDYEVNTGIEVSTYVTDPLLPHDGSYNQFFYAWAMIYSHTPERWIQVGWSEVSWMDNTQYVTEYDTEDNEWYFYPQYPLTVGNSYSFRITYQGNGRWATWIFWNDEWNLLRVASIGLYYAECTGQFCEVYSATYFWFHAWTRLHNTRLLIGGSWLLWTTAYQTTEYNPNQPYYIRWFNKYYYWEFTDIKIKSSSSIISKHIPSFF